MLYFDHASTSYPKPPEVHAAVMRCMEVAVNPGRGAYRLAAEAAEWVEQTRRRVARLFGLAEPSRAIFALSCTDALNMALKGVLRPGDRVLSSQLEHNAIARPLARMAEEGLLELEWLQPNPQGFLEAETLRAALEAGDTRLVALTHGSNVVGSIQPLEVLGPMVRDAGALLLVDAAQTAGAVAIDMEAMAIDLLAWPGHKGLHGYMGIGGLCVGPRAEASLRPWREGGTGVDSLSPTQPLQWPQRMEAGTHNLAGIASLHAGIQSLQMEGALSHQQDLRRALVEGLEGLGLRVLGGGPHEAYVGTLSLALPTGGDPHLLAGMLDSSFGIATRAGLHCAPLAHRAMGTSPQGTLRLSVGASTTRAQVQQVLEAIEDCTQQLGPILGL